MKTVEEIKDEEKDARVKFIEKTVIKAITARSSYVEILENYFTQEIKNEMETAGYVVRTKETDPKFIVVSW
jgi:hypothetical protein